jgi:hypothetical protein
MTRTTIGTVLPTAASLAVTERFAARQVAMKEKVARRELGDCTRRVVGGEVRYYDTADQYAVVSRQGTVLWFAVRADGDYRI